MNITETKGVRQNEGKPMFSPIDPKLLLEVGKVLADGQERYGEKAFNKNDNVMRLSTGYDSLMRHLLKFMGGENIDVEEFEKKGVEFHHLAKVIACAVVMWENRIKGDDRNC